jgi:hypothetical protein
MAPRENLMDLPTAALCNGLVFGTHPAVFTGVLCQKTEAKTEARGPSPTLPS